MNRLKTVLHVHTNFSHDSNRSPAELVDTAVRQGIDCIGITDHNQIEGALQARELDRVRVIVGEEILTADGDLIGLFLEQRVPPGMPAIETAKCIQAQGGLVLAPHPFATLCTDSLSATTATLLPWLSTVEICNSQNIFFWDDWRAARFARQHGLPGYVGADAHLRGYLAGGYQWMPDFDGPESFVNALRQAELMPKRFGPRYLTIMACQHLWHRLSGRPLPGFATNLKSQPSLSAD
ncbi:MAG: PHP domain-containing protein [Planctomycetota bacterium]